MRARSAFLLALLASLSATGPIAAQDALAPSSLPDNNPLPKGQDLGLTGFLNTETALKKAFVGSATSYPDRFGSELAAWAREGDLPPVDFKAAEVLRSLLDEASFAKSQSFADIEMVSPSKVREIAAGFDNPEMKLVPLSANGRLFVIEGEKFSVASDPVSDSPVEVVASPALSISMAMAILARKSDFVPAPPPLQPVEQEAHPQDDGPIVIKLPHNRGGDGSVCKPGTGPNSCLFPVVGLVRRGAPFCSGITIGPDTVLTAAHCVCPAPGRLKDADEAGITVFFGSNATPRMIGNGVTVPAKLPATLFRQDFCEQYETWRQTGGDYPDGDLAILRMARAVDYSVFENVPGFLDGKAFRGLREIEVAGFGTTSATRYPSYKNKARLTINSHDCSDLDPEKSSFAGRCRALSEFSAVGVEDGADSCHGDSGAPVFSRATNRLAIAGIVSRGVDGTCGPGGIQTLLHTPDVVDWLWQWGPVEFITPSGTEQLVSAIEKSGILQ